MKHIFATCFLLVTLLAPMLSSEIIPTSISNPSAPLDVFCGGNEICRNLDIFLWTDNIPLGNALVNQLEGWQQGINTFYCNYQPPVCVAPLNIPPHNGTGSGKNTNYATATVVWDTTLHNGAGGYVIQVVTHPLNYPCPSHTKPE